MDKTTADKTDEIARIIKEASDAAFRYPGTPPKPPKPRDAPPTLSDIAFAYPRCQRQ
jgi:hypothetical protein